MTLVWNAVALPGLVAALLAWAAAAVVLFSNPGRFANRALAFALAAEALGWFGGNGLIYVTDDMTVAYASQMLGIHGYLIFPFATLFLLSTLRTPLVRPFATRTGRALLVLGLVVALVSLHLQRALWMPGVRPVEHAAWDGTAGPVFSWFFLLSPVYYLFFLACTIDAYRRAPDGPARARARAFALAFGLRDVAIVALILLDGAGIIPFASVWIFPLVSIAFVALLAYGILKAQLFDIDLRIKWTIRRGTVVGILAIAFVVVAEVAQNWLSDAYGYLAGGLAAGGLLVALRPLDRIGSRVADVAMPSVEGTPAYLAFRKMEVYKAALEGASEDGEITHREREMLRRLRASLGILEADARALESDILSSRA